MDQLQRIKILEEEVKALKKKLDELTSSRSFTVSGNEEGIFLGEIIAARLP